MFLLAAIVVFSVDAFVVIIVRRLQGRDAGFRKSESPKAENGVTGNHEGEAVVKKHRCNEQATSACHDARWQLAVAS